MAGEAVVSSDEARCVFCDGQGQRDREHVIPTSAARTLVDVEPGVEPLIQRNIDAVGRTLTGKGEGAYDGIQEGLGDCDY